jgi:hypothetical protein
MQSKEKAVQQSESMRKRSDIFWPDSGGRRKGGESREKYVAKRLRKFFLYGNKFHFEGLAENFLYSHQQMNVVCSGLLMGNIDID